MRHPQQGRVRQAPQRAVDALSRPRQDRERDRRGRDCGGHRLDSREHPQATRQAARRKGTWRLAWHCRADSKSERHGMNTDRTLAHSHDIATKVALLFRKRAEFAREQFTQRLAGAAAENDIGELVRNPAASAKVWTDWYSYAVDATQRSILFWDTIRQRGNNFVQHTQAGLPPVLHFEFETVVDGRKLKRPVNYALVRIVPPEGVTVDGKRRPYVIIDPRAGHGPGIGGFKDDSQVGVALREGHPVYFVIFY